MSRCSSAQARSLCWASCTPPSWLVPWSVAAALAVITDTVVGTVFLSGSTPYCEVRRCAVLVVSPVSPMQLPSPVTRPSASILGAEDGMVVHLQRAISPAHAMRGHWWGAVASDTTAGSSSGKAVSHAWASYSSRLLCDMEAVRGRAVSISSKVQPPQSQVRGWVSNSV